MLHFIFRTCKVGLITLLGTTLVGCHKSENSDVQPTQPAAAPIPSANTVATTYTCPMHPEINLKHPGRCPKCGMELVPNKPQVGPISDHDR